MKKNKTTKLVCNVTGKVLLASHDYYNKKVEKAGTERALHETYMCRDARGLLKKGYSIQDTRTALNVDPSFESTMSDDMAQKLINGTSLRLNTIEHTNIGVVKTDPDVKQFIENILRDDNE